MVSMIAEAGILASSIAAEEETTGTISVGSCDSGAAAASEIDRKDLIDGDLLRGEDAIEALERERAFAIEEVGDMSLLKARLLGQPGAGERSPLDAAEEFEAKQFVEVVKIHGFGCF